MPDLEKNKTTVYEKTLLLILVTCIAVTILIVVFEAIRTYTPSPEKAILTEKVPALKLQKLISTGVGVSRGLYKVQIEGQTFLMVVDRDGVALVEYTPQAATQEQD